jgi:hypothetical protein
VPDVVPGAYRPYTAVAGHGKYKFEDMVQVYHAADDHIAHHLYGCIGNWYLFVNKNAPIV